MVQTMALLGAGASVEAGLPMAYTLAARVRELICDPASRSRYMHSGGFFFHANCVIPLIEHVYVHLVESVGGVENLDVELFGAAVDDAATIDLTQIAPLMSKANPDIDRWRTDGGRDAGRYVRDAVRQETWLSEARAEATSYLKWLFDIVRSSQMPTIATLNYDNTLELCAALVGQSLSYGVVTGWRPNHPLTFPTDVIALLKLHGSSNWSLGGTLETDKAVPGGFAPVSRHEVRVFSQAKMDEMTRDRSPIHNSILFGRGIKMRYEGPYIALHECFRKRLDGHDAIVVVGYSFRDHHINEDLANWLEQDERRRLIVVAPDAKKLRRAQGRLYDLARKSVCIDLRAGHSRVPSRINAALKQME